MKYAVHDILTAGGEHWQRGGRYKRRVMDRCKRQSGQSRQVVCLKITRETVQELHRSVLDEATWAFPIITEEV